MGRPTGFLLTPGQACDLDGADALLPALEAPIVIADKGYDADERVLQPLAQAGKTAVIPPKANRTLQRDYDKNLYQVRHRIENFFCQLKQFRAIATRYDKTARNFLAAVYLAAAAIWLNGEHALGSEDPGSAEGRRAPGAGGRPSPRGLPGYGPVLW